ncbi:uncharacterized protein SPAPADRAFT_58571 [Spathaspora passalidarum NRRL Y-27907]|uniref:Prokaryotic-type class I peptide chain release factors domain-containing protein n=1 Tax=Spathaspora passalidarum (strain NRRL Y-27907 / 11-Y1) TaxID=619300 RepID=G3AGK4_SPAPN|nr:uncharacterized protein SPAPADRAFT_58571 [Spathaspora passalidarum NRRL Y-27907]EGW35343.1 hypothetical protein SPAPADRAFT_58571 [Spathaspora passalidarum NRRL Y-27907]
MMFYKLPLYSHCTSILRLSVRVSPIVRFNSSITEFTTKEIDASKKWVEKFTPIQIPTDVFTISYSRSSGPGGQKVNKTSSKATVSLEPGQWLTPATSFWIPQPIQHQLKENKIRYETKGGGLLIQSDVFRSRDANTSECFKKLLEEIKSKVYFPGEVSEQAKQKWEKLEQAAKERRKVEKKILSEKKKSRSKSFDL